MVNVLKWFQGPQGPKGEPGPRGMVGVSPEPVRSPKFTALDLPDRTSVDVPRRHHRLDAGYDLQFDSPKPRVLLPGGRATVPTGVSVKLAPFTCGLILPRSGNASKLGLNVITGVVDAGYTGELKVTVHNTSRAKLTLEPGMKIAQMIVTAVAATDTAATDTERGVGGFGSTDTGPLEKVETSTNSTEDMVNHPKHYTVHPVFTGECHNYAQYMTFDQGNAFKYLWRCSSKGDMATNVRKALWYLNAMNSRAGKYKYGLRLDADQLERLEREASNGMNDVDLVTVPTKYRAALACYSAAALIAAGDVKHALELAQHALDVLNEV